MKQVISIVWFFFCLTTINGALCQSFQRLYGTINNDEFSSVLLLPNGDYIVTGTSFLPTGSDIYVSRMSPMGNVIWEGLYGGLSNEVAWSSVINNNGNVVVAGTSSSYNNGLHLDIILFEIDLLGNIQWARNYGTLVLDDVPRRINLTSTGLVICATNAPPASISPDILVFEVSFDGTIINWQNMIAINGGYGDIPSSIIQSNLGGYIVVGGSHTPARLYDQTILRLDNNGVLLTNIAYGSTGNENAQDVVELPNNDLVVMGNFRVLAGAGLEFALTSIRPDNTFNWIRTYGDNGNRNERAYGFTQNSDGGYAFCGYTDGVIGHLNDILLVITDSNGNLVNFSSYGDIGIENSSSIVQNTDNTFSVFGVSNFSGTGLNDGFFIKTDQNGAVTDNCSSYNIQQVNHTLTPLTLVYTQSNPGLSNSSVTINDPNISFALSNFVCTTTPVKLVSFKGERIDDDIILNWITSHEENSNFFAIERSEDSFNWQFVKNVKSEGNLNSIQEYEYIDKGITHNNSYYRLKQVDYNGAYVYSNVILVSSYSVDDYTISVSPSPSDGNISIDYFSKKRGIHSLMLRDLMGNVMFEKEIESDEKWNKIELDLTTLKAGVYILLINDGYETRSVKVVKK